MERGHVSIRNSRYLDSDDVGIAGCPVCLDTEAFQSFQRGVYGLTEVCFRTIGMDCESIKEIME